ncbi:MAG TPA: hypothetical protein PK867_14590, partial [Pirellulales bacterium]|nr:hypothetical protein [Pirellulales bacterium]
PGMFLLVDQYVDRTFGRASSFFGNGCVAHVSMAHPVAPKLVARLAAAAEAENILKATLKYLAGRPSRRTARFDVNWMVKLHREMFGDVWRWAGEIRSRDLNIGVPFYHVRPELQALADDLAAWREITVKPSVAPTIRRR